MERKIERPRRRLSFESLESRRVLASFVVVNTNDSGTGSMREAILRSNQNPGLDSIVFAIADAIKSIKVTAPLPNIVDPVLLDATTQPGYAGTPLVELQGSLLASRENGLSIQAGNCIVKGLAIHSFPGDGILITGPGSNIIESNYIGTDLAGTLSKANGGSGVQVLESPSNRIGGPQRGNLLSGNKLEGLRIWGAKSLLNSVEGNRIGTDANGTAPLANGLSGVLIASGASGNDVGLGFVDDTVSKRNIISGNLESGIRISNAKDNSVKGNYIGLDSSGATPLGNRSDGILVEGNSIGNVIGANAADNINDALEKNWIAGNNDNGIRLFNASFNQIAGNSIGLNIHGNATPNASNGILIDGKSNNNVVGLQYGLPETMRNVISGNARSGIEIFDSTGNRISGNYVGTSPDGLTAIPNLDGIVVARGSDNNVIGLDIHGVGGLSSGNVISGNTRNGIWLVESSRTKVSQNLIGLASSGLVALPNQHSGVWISYSAHDNVIGTDLQDSSGRLEGNVISGNLLQGVSIGGTGSDNNRIAGNWIGTDTTGAAAIPNQTNGILIYDGAKKNKIGGPVPDQQNIISGNQGWGVSIEFNSGETAVVGNRIGLVEGSLSVLGNTSGGVRISQSSNNQIGDGSFNGSNWISNNGPVGIQVIHESSSGNAISNNYITNHSLVGIDLGGDGPTPNDAQDSDTGPNQLQNYPIVEFVAVSSNRTQIAGKLESTPNSTFQIELFGQQAGVLGNSFAASINGTTDSNGIAYWLYDQPSGIAPSTVVYATTRNASASQSEISPGQTAEPLFTMQAPATPLREGGPTLNITLQRPSTDTSQQFTVKLTSSDSSQLTMPSQLTIPSGQLSVQFSVTAIDDAILERPTLVRILAESTSPGLGFGAIQLTVLDNDSQWHNYAMPLDVDHDNNISPLDVITIINYLNSNQNSNLASAAAPNPRSYIDVDEDLFA
ncbi:MAG: dockerin type I domain-containing protein, partial [Planctomycetota bacterium]|nr:dockerin type I domain-containing protein [Planctomycetota bacterium]